MKKCDAASAAVYALLSGLPGCSYIGSCLGISRVKFRILRGCVWLRKTAAALAFSSPGKFPSQKKEKSSRILPRTAWSNLSAFPYMSIYIRIPGFRHRHPRIAAGFLCSSGLLKQSLLQFLFYKIACKSSNSSFRYAGSVEITEI